MFTTFFKNPMEFAQSAQEYFNKFPKSPDSAKAFFEKAQEVFKTEAENVTKMAEIYRKSATGDATINELNQANKIAQDLYKASGLALFCSTPFGIFALPALAETARQYDIELFPASVIKAFNL
jgi:hypothetical protein